VPVLIEALRDPDIGVRDRAVRRLGRFGPNANAAVPKLLELLEEENRALKESPNSLFHRAIRGGLVQAITEINGETP
jgi:HEAT repeat protein